jgi:purine-cytosine permease-like protein
MATLTTNFVNIYLSALAWKSLFVVDLKTAAPRDPAASPALRETVPRADFGRTVSRDRASIGVIGSIGTALALLPGAGLDRYVDFIVLLGGMLVPAGGVLVAFFVVRRAPVDVLALYDRRGPYAGLSGPAVTAWALGAAAYFAASRAGGGTLPGLVTSLLAYLLLSRARSLRPSSR